MKVAGAFPPLCGSISKPLFSNQFATVSNLQKFTKFTTISLPFAVDSFACGATHVALLHDKQVYCWGDNARAQCGKNPTEYSLLKDPLLIENLPPIHSVYCGRDFTIALDSTKQHLFLWGSNEQVNISNQYQWKLLYSLQGNEQIDQLHCGTHSMLFTTNSHTCYGWGSSNYGQLGTGELFPISTPRSIFLNATQVGTGMDQSYLVTHDKDQQLYCCGRMQSQQYHLSWTPVEGMNSIHCLSVGYQHVCVTRHAEKNKLHVWGQGITQGIPHTAKQHYSCHTFTQDIVSIHSGAYHSLIRLHNGDWYGLGLNSDGQLGIDSTQNQKDPIFIMNSDKDTCKLGFSFSLLK